MSRRAIDTVPESWSDLQRHYAQVKGRHMLELFAADERRQDRFSTQAAGLLLDYSKNRATGETMTLLVEAARQAGLEEWIEKLYTGAEVNTAERRPALHTALRRPIEAPDPVRVQGLSAELDAQIRRAEDFAGSLRSGRRFGFSERPIETLVHVGIGGSELGVKMAATALGKPGERIPRVEFVSNLDSSHLGRTLDRLDPASTVILVASKSFTTSEVLRNAASARAWLLKAADQPELAIDRQLFAATANPAKAAEFGFPADNVFALPNWVGGRFCTWSSIGLALIVAIGSERYRRFRRGAWQMDEHFRNTPFERNMPVILGLLGVWYRNFFGVGSQGIFPYDYALRHFPAYLQQLEMESNGKSVKRSGQPVESRTSPVIWGGLGIEGQHAFFQFLHQGTEMVPSDFVVPARSQHPLPEHREEVVANALAQTEALMRGLSREELEGSETATGAAEPPIAHRVMAGNQPTNTIVFDRLEPETLGALMALYEHKVFTQSVLWGTNPFDQWGVEMGKTIARRLSEALKQRDASLGEYASLSRVVTFIRNAWRAADNPSPATAPQSGEAVGVELATAKPARRTRIASPDRSSRLGRPTG